MRRALTAFCLLFLSVPTFAQTMSTPAPEYYLVHEEIARPGMLPQYESTTRDLLTMLTDQKADPKVMAMNLFVTTDMHYLYVVRLANFGSIDTINQTFATVAQGVGKDRWAEIMRRGNSAMESYNEFVMVRRPDLSYVAATPRLKPEERRFFHLQFFYIDAAHIAEAEQVAKDIVALFKSKNVTDGYNVYQLVTGTDLPVYVVSIGGRNASDFYANDERNLALVGAEYRPLQARVLSYARKYEVKDAFARPELSYPMPAAAPAAK